MPPGPLGPWVRATVTVLWILALLVAVSPWFLVPVALSIGLWILFAFAVIAAAGALAAASAGVVVIIRSKGPLASFAIAYGFLTVNLGAAAFAASAWYSSASCRRVSGPCTTQLVMCCGGLAAIIVAALFAGSGLLGLWRSRDHGLPPPSR